MNKCLKITINLELKEGFLQNVVQKYARTYELEGLVQPLASDRIKIVICGKRDKVDLFIDALHRELLNAAHHDIEIEPFLKDKDYRGVFRIIE